MPKIIGRTAARVAGLKYYFTGKSCKRGHTGLRSVATGRCNRCAADDQEARRQANPEKEKARMRQYIADNRDSWRARAKAWREANPERFKEKNRAWRAAHPNYGRERYWANREEALEQSRIWYEANKQRRNATSKAWERANATARAAIAARYRARLASAEGYFTQDDVERILEEQGYHCANPNCQADLLRRFDIDHKTPISPGGSNWPENLQCLCHSCNTSKGDKTMEEWSGAVVKPKRRRRFFSG